jgi:crotonobetainyl-CoA:carnitine CoA-transferase CaiB-like acyl-CoA transferase
MSSNRAPGGGFLDGVRILEVADELGEYCGRVLAGVGADVVKVEPPTGEVTRSYGPFVDDVPDSEGSLYILALQLRQARDRARSRRCRRTGRVPAAGG